MAKKRKEKDLVMHKLLGEHKMVKTQICEVCGITEGQQIIEPYEPVHMTSDQVMELMKTIMSLAEAVRQLQIAQQFNDRDRWERERRDRRPWERDMVPVPHIPEERWKKEYELEPDWEKFKELLPDDSQLKKYETKLKKSLGVTEIKAKGV